MNRSRGRRALTRFTTIAVALALMVVGLVAVQPVQPAQALSGSDFQPGYIIDDSQFYDANGMTQAQIQAFLESKEPGNCSNSNCLKLLRTNTTDIAPYFSDTSQKTECQAYKGASNELASSVLFKVQQACGISAKVILATVQKEQGLVTNMGPSDVVLRRVLGMGCPDSAGGSCAETYDGFFKQMYWGARQFKTYQAAPQAFNYRAGRTYNIPQFDLTKDPTCGTRTVYIANNATAALYDYTPYTPNDAALANLTGSIPKCGAYGNRNFWVFYNNWFGSPVGNPSGALQSTTVGNNTVTVSGWAVDADVQSAAISVRITSDAGWSQTVVANTTNSASQATFPAAGTNHGFSATVYAATGSQQVCATAVNQGLGANVSLGCATATVSSPLVVQPRISGVDRYNTAIQISAANFSPGVPVAYLASGEDFPDALSAVPAAAAQGAPLLLTQNGSIPSTVLAELKRLAPQKVIIVGGNSAISSTAETQLSAAGLVPQRIDGVDRYQTSLRVGAILGAQRKGKVYLATGSTFPDAISAAAAAGFQDAPLVLVDGTSASVPSSVAAALADWGVTQVTLIGGTAAISGGFQSAVSALPGITSVVRLSGVDRYSTSIAVNVSVFGTAKAGYIATGTAYPDGLTGGALAGHKGEPLYLSLNTCVPSGVIQQFLSASGTSITPLGGTQALTDAVTRLAPC